MFWLQTVAGEVDSKTGIPPPLLCLQIKDFLNGPGGNRAHTHTLLYTHEKRRVGFNKRGQFLGGFFTLVPVGLDGFFPSIYAIIILYLLGFKFV